MTKPWIPEPYGHPRNKTTWKPFASKTEDKRWEKEQGKCQGYKKKCKKQLSKAKRNFDFDHRMGNDDISFRNCQLLCLECHRAKTKAEARKPERRSKISKTKKRNEARKPPSLKKQSRSEFKVPKIPWK
ncbi:HNH endonuclease protein [Marine Group I thaumarchaeote SCGC AAA799-O18]|nr:HNH endonuclease protein [Marine Group I thaumarchaeote SCGC AAA799-O18]